MTFFRSVSRRQQIDAAPHVFFALDVHATSRGSLRVPADLGIHLNNEWGGAARFIHPLATARTIEQNPKSIVVGLNVPAETLADVADTLTRETRRAFLTIGIQSFDDYSVPADIILSPVFNPIPHKQDRIKTGKVVIDYTYTPSHMAFLEGLGNALSFPQQKPQQAKDSSSGKTLAVYMRSYNHAGGESLFEICSRLNQKYDFKFLVSTGPNTCAKDNRLIKDFFASLAGSECFTYDQDNPEVSLLILTEIFKRADAIVQPWDSVSTLSDAVSTCRPVLIATNYANWGQLGTTKMPFDKNVLLQQALITEGRARIFSETTALSNWRPACSDQWQPIRRQIAGHIQSRLDALAKD